MAPVFNKDRLKVARMRRSRKLGDLAAAVGVPRQRLSDYEKGTKEPPLETLERLAVELQFPLSFFGRASRDLIEHTGVSFRSVTALPASLRDTAIAASEIAFDFTEYVAQKFDLPELDLPDLSDEEPEVAGLMMRAHFGLDSEPVESVIDLMEAYGVRVFSLNEDTAKVDAFCLWKDNVPFVFLNTKKSPERSRFDCAHELGHLVLHRSQPPQGKAREDEANRFASSFLMPDEHFLATVPDAPTSLPRLRALKFRWRVSLAAAIKRLHTLKVISDWEFRDLYIRASGLRSQEPEPRLEGHERSAVLLQIQRGLRDAGISIAAVANELSVPKRELDGLIFNLLPASPVAADVSADDHADDLEEDAEDAEDADEGDTPTPRPALRLLR